MLADYVGEPVTIRYAPRDLAELRIFHQDRFLCRAICSELAGRAIGIKDITAARKAGRHELTGQLRTWTSVVDQLLAVHQPGYGDLLAEPPPTPAPTDAESVGPVLKHYREE